MNFTDSLFHDLYYHELWWLSHSIKRKCEYVFKATVVPDEGYSIVVSAEVHSNISSLLSDAANIKKLFITPSAKLNGENRSLFKLRQERASVLSDFLGSLNIKEMLSPKVRNTLEHFDEYLDRANYEITKSAIQNRVAVYNIVLSHWEALSPRVYPLRLYISNERKFYNMQWSIDIGLLYVEASSIVEKLEGGNFLSGNEPGGLMIRI
ncbi:hypothetical protein KID95_24815 [Pseudomonas syringae]|nr:hypothetical protein [Pseudomonas syringae]